MDEVLKCDMSGVLTVISVPEVEQGSKTAMDDAHSQSTSGQ